MRASGSRSCTGRRRCQPPMAAELASAPCLFGTATRPCLTFLARGNTVGNPLLIEGVSQAKTEHEDHEADRADCEEGVSRHTEPAKGLHDALAEELAAAGIPVA